MRYGPDRGGAVLEVPWVPAPTDAPDGIVNLTAETSFPEIFLDTHVPKY